MRRRQPRWFALLVCVACSASSEQRGSGSPHPAMVGAHAPAASVAPAAAAASAALGDRAQWSRLARRFIAERVRTGHRMACAISKRGVVACWGAIEASDDSTAVERRAGVSTPHVLVGIEGAIDVAAEWFYLCVAQREGAGDGRCFVVNDIDRPPPRFPAPPVEFAPVDDGICARMRDGSVGCVDLRGRYTAASEIRQASHLSCRDAACCAITPAGVRCFGERAPALPELPAVTELTLGSDRGCARTTAGGAVCWGAARALSQAGGVTGVGRGRDGDICVVRDDGAMACSADRASLPSKVAALAGDCVLHTGGAVSCTGGNDRGQLGDGALMLSAAPVPVPGLTDVVDLNVAHTDACAVKRDGSLWCWGPSGVVDRGRAGGPFVTAQYVSGCRLSAGSVRCGWSVGEGDWDAMAITPKVRSPSAAAIHRDGSLCVVDGKGAVSCRHGMAEAGLDTRWVRLAAPAPVADLQPLGQGFCARHRDGRVSCFVDHRYDNDDDFLDKLPTGKLALVRGITGATQLATGQDEACVIRQDGTVWCWRADRPAPREMTTLRGATSLGANHRHACAVVRKEVWCWGEGSLGELGDGAGRSAEGPVQAKTSFEAVAVGTGRQSTCALDEGGSVWCWGANTEGELGHPHRRHTLDWSRVVGIGPR